MANVSDTIRQELDRRHFLRTTGGVGLALAANAYAGGNDTLRVGVIGCGGRGPGAAGNILSAAPGISVVALGDVFEDRLKACRQYLLDLVKAGKPRELGNTVDLPLERCFIGLDAYRNVISAGVDVVILATPGVFRPVHLQAAVAAGKHVFAEKPVAVDATGVRKVLAAGDDAKRKGLSVVVGMQRRYQDSYREMIKRLHNGAIGAITAAECWWNQGLIWARPRQPEMSDVVWQLRNWINICWLSGDIIVEHLLHNLDVVTWALDAHPLVVSGEGGRLPETGPQWGNRFDHFSVEYQFPGGVIVKGQCRWLANRENKIGEQFQGSKGTCQTRPAFPPISITGAEPWQSPRTTGDPYIEEQVELVRSIRTGKPINDLPAAARSTLTAVMGRMAAYTGEAVTWEQAGNSTEDLLPERLDLGAALPLAPVPTPKKHSDPGINLPSLYILAIGVSKYKDESLNLNYAAKDAEATVKAFKDHGQQLFKKIEARLLTDRDATRADILKGLTWLSENMTQKDFGVVFFSGHGDRDTDGTVNLLPVDADVKELLATGVPLELLKKATVKLPGKVLVLLDACHSGGIDGGKRKSVKSLPDELLRDLTNDESGLVVMCSSTGREFSLENNEHRQGNFTLALIEGLSGKAPKGTDGAVYLHHLDAYITDRVKDLTKGRQHPVTSKPSTIRSFPLAKP